MHPDTLKFYKYKPVKKPKFQGKFCSAPFDILEIDHDGDVTLCGCQLFMPYVVGNIYTQSLKDIWLGVESQKVRQAVVDGDFTYCNWACGTLENLNDRPAQLPELKDFPAQIKLDMDRSCNLKCPSCREGVIIEKHGDKIDKQVELYQEIVDWARANPTRRIIVYPVSSGEVFASHSGLKFLQSLADYPYDNIRLGITTNGTLLNRNRDLLTSIQHLIDKFSVSIDAATAETYSVVRGGDWNELLLGLEFLNIHTNVPLNFNFCIQQKNWKEIEQFVEFAKKYQARVDYQKLLDWGHWNQDWWHDNNIFDRTKPEFNLVIDMLRRIVDQEQRNVGIANAEIMKYMQRTESP